MDSATPILNLIVDKDDPLGAEDRALVGQLAEMIDRIERSISRLLQFHAQRGQITLLEAQALASILKLQDKARLSTIAETVHMPLSTMTGVAARLEKAGLTERKRATDDGRAFVLSLTPAGIEKLRQVFQPLFAEVAQIIDKTGPDTLQSVVDSFTLVCELAEELGKSTEAEARS